MSFWESLVDKALSPFVEKKNAFGLTDNQVFCREYHISDEEEIVRSCLAEVTFTTVSSREQRKRLRLSRGKVWLTNHFLVYTDIDDPHALSFTLNLSTVKKVERNAARGSDLVLTVSTHTKMHISFYLVGLSSDCERFSQLLKICLRKNLERAPNLKAFIPTCYSEYLLYKNNASDEKIEAAPLGGLGLVFKFPGNPKETKEKPKLKLWFEYFLSNGRNLTLVRAPMFYRLIKVGIPNRLRGEIWELCCGSMYLRLNGVGEYEKILDKNKNKHLVAIEEIEKDLNRSLPEYAAFQDSEGIGRLRRVLTAYSWRNPDVGYCQAMNIVVAALLIQMSEEQAFWALDVLCDRIVPGYYSKTMYGTLLDQRVFESLVQKTMPLLWEHINEHDIQLSVVSLPWFLSLYLTSMPLIFAFRIMDVFFSQGPKTLFQVALAVLRINGEQLLQTQDDGTFISILKSYFSTLHDSAHPNATNLARRDITKFQELLVVSFKEFSNINDETIEKHRTMHRDSIFLDISTFVKRTELRNLPRTKNIDLETLSVTYDRFYGFVESFNATMGSGLSLMDYDAFSGFMADTCDWVVETQRTNDYFLKCLFHRWDTESQNALALADLVLGLNRLLDPDLMALMNYFFDLYDKKKCGEIDREGILQMSEDLLTVTTLWKEGHLLDRITVDAIENAIADEVYARQTQSHGDELGGNIDLPAEISIDREKIVGQQQERYLSAASAFLKRAFEYAQPVETEVLLEELKIDDKQIANNAALNPNAPVTLNLATFRMVILADETYELLFSHTLRELVHLEKPLTAEFNPMRNLRDMFDGLLADGRKVATKVRRRMDSAATSANSALGGKAQEPVAEAEEEEEEEEEDFGVISISDHDKDLLLETESHLLHERPRLQSTTESTESHNGRAQPTGGTVDFVADDAELLI